MQWMRFVQPTTATTANIAIAYVAAAASVTAIAYVAAAASVTVIAPAAIARAICAVAATVGTCVGRSLLRYCQLGGGILVARQRNEHVCEAPVLAGVFSMHFNPVGRPAAVRLFWLLVLGLDGQRGCVQCVRIAEPRKLSGVQDMFRPWLPLRRCQPRPTSIATATSAAAAAFRSVTTITFAATSTAAAFACLAAFVTRASSSPLEPSTARAARSTSSFALHPHSRATFSVATSSCAILSPTIVTVAAVND